MIILLVCQEDKKVWCINFNQLDVKKITIVNSIKSKYY